MNDLVEGCMSGNDRRTGDGRSQILLWPDTRKAIRQESGGLRETGIS